MSLSDALDSEVSVADLPRLNGRAARLPSPLSIRSLTSGEVERASKGEGGTTRASPLTRITGRHRLLAQYIAQGMGTTEAARRVGLTVSYTSILKNDPTFQDLISHAKAHQERAFIDTNERLAAITGNALDEINERFEEDPAQFSTDELLHIAALGADRTGFGPKKTEERNINLNFGDHLAAARARAAEAAKAISAPLIEEATLVEEPV